MQSARIQPILFAVLLACSVLPGGLALRHINRQPVPYIAPYVAAVQKLPLPAAATDAPVRGIAFGDIMLDRYVATLMRRHGNAYPFLRLQPLLGNHDVVFANLEGPIVPAYRQTPDDALRFSFPSATAALLKAQGWTTLSIANNHSLDHGAEGFATTRAALREAGLDAVGDPATISRSSTVTRTLRGRTVAFAAFHATQSSFARQEALDLIADLAAAADTFVVVSVHWGNEYQTHSNAFQQRLGRAFIDAGADLVLGHHPHVVQEIAIYRNRPIFFSLGNLIFDQYFSADTQQMLGVRFTMEPDRIRYDLLPLASTKSQPQLMEDDAAQRFLQDLASRSTWGDPDPRTSTAAFTLPWPGGATK